MTIESMSQRKRPAPIEEGQQVSGCVHVFQVCFNQPNFGAITALITWFVWGSDRESQCLTSEQGPVWLSGGDLPKAGHDRSLNLYPLSAVTKKSIPHLYEQQ